MHVSAATFATTIFGLYVLGAQASPYLRDGEAGLARSRRWNDHPSDLGVHRASPPHHHDHRRRPYVYSRDLPPLQENFKTNPLYNLAPSPNSLQRRTPMYAGAVGNNFRYIRGSSSSSSECSRSSSSGDYSDTSGDTMKYAQCLERNYPSDGGGRSPPHRQSIGGLPNTRPGTPDLGRSSSDLSRAGSAELETRMKNRFLVIVGQDNKLHITGVNGIIGLFIYVAGEGIAGGHIDPRNEKADIITTINFAKARTKEGEEIKAMVFANNEHDYGLVKNMLRQAFPKLSVKKIVYKWHYERGFWEFVAQFSKTEGIEVTKRWIPEREWDPKVELEGVRISKWKAGWEGRGKAGGGSVEGGRKEGRKELVWKSGRG
ncbi:hypothetical protein MMC30_008716 [Trapelia coarctata]|nr:hypothetical protein [Trapelia coarctata]